MSDWECESHWSIDSNNIVYLNLIIYFLLNTLNYNTLIIIKEKNIFSFCGIINFDNICNMSIHTTNSKRQIN